MSTSIDDKKIKQLEEIMKLMKEYKVNHVEIEDIKVNRTHVDLDYPKQSTPIETEEDILFHSSDY